MYAKVVNDFYNEVDKSIQKDIKNIKEQNLEYLLSIFEGQKDKMQREKTVLCMELEDRLDEEKTITLEVYLSKYKSTLERLDNYKYFDGCEYEYYQSKLDWYTMTSYRLYNFIKALVELG